MSPEERIETLEKEFRQLRLENKELKNKVEELDGGFNKMAKLIMSMGKQLMKLSSSKKKNMCPSITGN